MMQSSGPTVSESLAGSSRSQVEREPACLVRKRKRVEPLPIPPGRDDVVAAGAQVTNDGAAKKSGCARDEVADHPLEIHHEAAEGHSGRGAKHQDPVSLTNKPLLESVIQNERNGCGDLVSNRGCDIDDLFLCETAQPRHIGERAGTCLMRDDAVDLALARLRGVQKRIDKDAEIPCRQPKSSFPSIMNRLFFEKSSNSL